MNEGFNYDNHLNIVLFPTTIATCPGRCYVLYVPKMQRLKALQRLASRAKHPSCFSGKIEGSMVDTQMHRCFAAQPDAASPDEDLIEVIVNGRPVSVPKGSNVLQACEAGGVDIPRYVLSHVFFHT